MCHADNRIKCFLNSPPLSMGLLISKRIIESYGGYLEAKKNLKENVSFNFILPTEKGHTE